MNTKLLALIGILLIVTIAQAVPTTGVAHSISSNNFTVPVVGSAGNAWIAWGQAEDVHPWASQIYTSDGDFLVFGAPIIGGSTVYYAACDESGCGNERTLTIPAITPIPTTTFGTTYQTLADSHFRITLIPESILPGYLASGITPTLLWGLLFFFLFFGFWFRTRSVRLTLILGFLMSAFILTPSAGLYLGAPLMFQFVAQGLMAAAIAGVLIAFIRK